MKSSTQLDSVVFQLTPTRTRFELVISANGKTEKVASGLLNPYLAHLKTAQEQMSKGGYSIILQPDPGISATWFTKGTIERFVRFVNTPEILERVYTVESEILQIEEAIAIQSNNNIGLSTSVEEHSVKPSESIEGKRATPDSYEEKAIILYAPDARPPEANGSAVQEGNPKLQLLKVLETRKTVLQKEQGMAFARAVAAGFNIDDMAPLMSFSERFGASRLRDACVKFTELWKRKHEDGQWLEIEATEAMAGRSDFSAMKELKGAWPGISEDNGKTVVESSTDEKPPMDQQTPAWQEYSQARFPHPMFPPWPIQSPPSGMPTFQGYAMQGMSYPHYPACSPFFQQPYPSMEDPKLDDGRRVQRGHSMGSQNGSDAWKLERAKPQDDRELENETSLSPKSRKKSSRSSKKQSGMVVIQNINYITPKKRNSSDSDSQSHSGSEMNEEDGDSAQKNSLRSSKRKGNRMKPVDLLNSFDKEETVSGKETHGGQWQAFQNYLLRGAEEEERKMDKGVFSAGKEVQGKRRLNRAGEDHLASGGRETGQYKERNTTDMHASGGRMLKAPSNDHSLISKNGDHSVDGRILIDGLHYMEVDGRRVYRSSMNDDFIVDKQKNQSDFTNSQLDPLAVNGFERSSKKTDDSYIVPFRSTSITQVGTDDQNAINMDSEFSLSLRKAGTTSNRVGSHVNYKTNDLTLMPQRGTEMGSIGYDPALDYEMQAHAENGTSLDKKNKEGMKGSKKLDIRKPKLIADPLDKKKTVEPMRKEKPSKKSPLDEAKARAERLRNYKADLQKMKKEKEEAEIRRLEALKMERQKRIAARSSSSGPAQSSMAAQSRKQFPLKLSPSSLKGSKFTDAEPGLSSPLQRSIRTPPVGSPASLKTPKPSKLRTDSSANRVSKSGPSLPVLKKDISSVAPDAKASMARIGRLLEPKINGSARVPSVKSRSSEPSSKTKVFRGPESRKISAIVNYDNSKIASLPELKIKTTKAPDITHSKSRGNEMTQKVNGSISSTTNVTELNIKPEKVSYDANRDDGTVIEKTIVMLEREKPSVPTVNSSEGTATVQKGDDGFNKIGRKAEKMVPDYAAPRAPVSSVDTLDKEHWMQQGSQAYEVQKVNVSNTKKELQKVKSSSVTRKPYETPFARVSSSESTQSEVPENSRASPTRLQATVTQPECVRARVADSKNLKLEKIPEVLDKPQLKESSKGFRRLLKFGRKNHSSATSKPCINSDGVHVNGSLADELVANPASSSKVCTLKNLLSQGENPIASSSTPKKSARSFSLLSPFKSKTSEKLTA
ncbi:COP1-interacting protein-related, putative isoform 3 [Hibiscus syriacus]|uniref:COP1-interacting protein-related, putative isoform 3 n=1 Tax=Hibiscus syriacus TaxID=106335 RepID=A0A6A3D0K1_HIBSY|nr:COP1-interacting protein 7-like [Hibiscus syriacus]KAE8734144.1 COP1-interacting protein-related, putative isoform 3 [Hibiscus syriacus]